VTSPPSRRVLVTGGASGLGAAFVAEFLKRGDQVVIADLQPPVDPALVDGAEQTRLDVTSDDDWAAALTWVEEHWGGLDVLVNNAGIAAGGRIDVVGIDEWQRVIDINLLGVVRGCRTFVPMMKAQGSGHIVNTASLAGLVHPPAMASYTAVKAGVVALSETMSYELDPFGIFVSAVCPGFVRTPLASSITGSDPVANKIAARLIEKSPYTPDQIAIAVMTGIDRKQMVIVPDRPARIAVLTKRTMRPLYDRQQRGFAARIFAITEGVSRRAPARSPRPPEGKR
jgi:NAD(P)-dependent dehydrogenase (short-subunit alcohol dehydrogenase family)